MPALRQRRTSHSLALDSGGSWSSRRRRPIGVHLLLSQNRVGLICWLSPLRRLLHVRRNAGLGTRGKKRSKLASGWTQGRR